MKPAKAETAEPAPESRSGEGESIQRLKVLAPGPREPAEPAPPIRDDRLAEAGPPRAARFATRGLRLAVLLALIAAAAFGGHYYWTVARFIITTDNAYLGADIVGIAPRIAAYVTDVPVKANQRVKAGDVLVRLDSGDAEMALRQAEAKLETQRAAIARIDSAGAEIAAQVAQARAALQAAEADATRAQGAHQRIALLSGREHASQANLDNALAERDRALALLAGARAALESTRAREAALAPQRKEAEQIAAELALAVEKARRDLTFTTLAAPADGIVSAKAVQPGDYVPAGKRLISLVQTDALYLDANFKETQIGAIVPGMPVSIVIDAFPDERFEGVVTSFSGGTGSMFSLLPQENATGNFTKIVQRLPVRVALKPGRDLSRLRPGMSAIVRIDTRAGPGAAPR